MDACLMATLEVCYQLRQHARYLVASEEPVPLESWPYDAILHELRARPETAARELARLIVDDYLVYYAAHPPARGGVTQVAVDLGQINRVAEATGHLALALLADMDNQKKALWVAQFHCLRQETRGQRRLKNKFQVHLCDLATLSRGLAGNTANVRVREAAQSVVTALQPGGAVITEGHRGEWLDGLGGLSIYLPVPGRMRISPYYAELVLARDTRWDEMLKDYEDAIRNR